MPLTRKQKEDVVGAMARQLKEAEAIVVADYRGLSVTQLSRLRRRLREAGAEFKVIKNTLLLRAFDSAGIQAPTDLLQGPTALALMYDDVSAPSKALVDFAKETDLLALKGGVLAGQRISADTAEALASLPSRDELLAQLLWTMKAPMQQYVGVLSAPLRGFLNVLNAHVEAG